MKQKAINTEKVIKADVYQAFSAIKTPAEAKQFLEDLCTPAEIEAIEDRWRVIPLLKSGTPYRSIYDATGISVTTIGRIARCLRNTKGGYNLIYNRLIKSVRGKT